MRSYTPTATKHHKPHALWMYAGLPTSKGLLLSEALQSGLPLQVLDNIHQWSDLSKSDIMRIAGINERNITRRKANKQNLSADESERIARLVRVFDAAVLLFDGDKDKAWQWLQKPAKALGHIAPTALLNSESGALEVLDLIARLEHGIFS